MFVAAAGIADEKFSESLQKILKCALRLVSILPVLSFHFYLHFIYYIHISPVLVFYHDMKLFSVGLRFI